MKVLQILKAGPGKPNVWIDGGEFWAWKFVPMPSKALISAMGCELWDLIRTLRIKKLLSFENVPCLLGITKEQMQGSEAQSLAYFELQTLSFL